MTIASLEPVLLRSLEAVAHTAILGGIAAAICWLFGRRLAPRWKQMLWLLIFMRLALPFLPPEALTHLSFLPRKSWSPLSWNDLEPTSGATVLTPPPSHQRSPRPSAAPTATIRLATSTSLKGNSTEIAESVPRIAKVRDSRTWLNRTWLNRTWLNRTWLNRTWLNFATGIWLLGIATLLLRQAAMERGLQKKRASWTVPKDERVLAIWQHCCETLDIHAVQLRLSRTNDGPATTGILRPCIVIPSTLGDSLCDDELRYVFLHELTHVKGHDLFVLRFAAFVTTIHWFNPIAWLSLGATTPAGRTGLRRECSAIPRCHPASRVRPHGSASCGADQYITGRRNHRIWDSEERWLGGSTRLPPTRIAARCWQIRERPC